jgi:predicted acylesterase/phospholipase RssA
VAGTIACVTNFGCSGVHRGPAVPKDLQDHAVVAGMPNIRTWGDYVTPEFRGTIVEALRRRQAHWAATGQADHPPAGAVLAISGGGANGAFGAGLLCGWTQKGDRPEFEVVTGISTGALIAPFAYLGPDYDPVLREVYTKVSTSSILKKRGLLAAVFSDALADSGPLWKLMRKHVNRGLLDAIAAEYEKGRFLLIGTVNLDSRRSVV